jgi:hypothetical protein
VSVIKGFVLAARSLGIGLYALAPTAIVPTAIASGFIPSNSDGGQYQQRGAAQQQVAQATPQSPAPEPRLSADGQAIVSAIKHLDENLPTVVEQAVTKAFRDHYAHSEWHSDGHSDAHSDWHPRPRPIVVYKTVHVHRRYVMCYCPPWWW